jgi:SAM-dependent methyltransferase
MNEEELSRWFEASRVLFETAYLAGTTPWQRSGVGLHTPRSEHDWEVLRRPIADCVHSSGTFLDIGCANGYLLECLLGWMQARRLEIVPYGLDFSEALVALARERLSKYAQHLYVGNAWNWSPPVQFTYVNSTLDYMPPELREVYVRRLLERFVQPGGRLLLAEYLGRSTGVPEISLDERLRRWGFPLKEVRSVHLEHDPQAQTRVVAIDKPAGGSLPWAALKRGGRSGAIQPMATS